MEKLATNINEIIIEKELQKQDNLTENEQVLNLLDNSKTFRNKQLIKYYIKKGVYNTFKRTIDICAGLLGTMFLLPIMLIVKIAYIKDGDHDSILFKQERIGKDGKKIYIYKIRSMVSNAQEILKEMLKEEKYREEWRKYQKFENDPRITKIGKFIRKTSLDEFPQFYNVLMGDLSLIGPRPLLNGELDEHNGNHEIYESVKPGITGWWGCNGRSATTYEERLELEYYYAKNCSIWLDIKCIFKTVASVLLRKGAK